MKYNLQSKILSRENNRLGIFCLQSRAFDIYDFVAAEGF